MKKVLLLGDSIRMGYDDYVKMAFDEVAEIYFPAGNGCFAAYMLRYLPLWEKELFPDPEDCKKVSLVHWNTGLWDCLEQLDGQVLTELPEYRRNLLRVHNAIKLLFPNASQVFATSTAVVEHRFGRLKRKNCVTEQYNRVAVELLEPLGVGINDLYALTKDFPESYYSDCTHLNTKEGQSAIVGQVVARLEQELGVKAKPLDFEKLFAKETVITGI